MNKPNKQNLDIKKTIDTTLDRAHGWLLGQYPSSLNHDINIQLNVYYPGQNIPHSANEGYTSYDSKLNLNGEPNCIIIKRAGNEIFLKRNVHYVRGLKKQSYILSIRSQNNSKYRIVETPDGSVFDKGNHLLLWALQIDPDFKKYISFFSKNKEENNNVCTQKWDLDHQMKLTRPSKSR